MSLDKGIGRVAGNVFMRDGKVLLSKIVSTEDLKSDVLKAVDLIGGIFIT
jgi:hypothetical protein